jgi:membrane protease YdiL (CAAX protease family)
MRPNPNVPIKTVARRGLAIYLAVVATLSAPIQVVTIRADLDGGANGAAQWIALMAALMSVPTIASVVARIALREGFADVSFRLGGRRGRDAVLLALALPVALGAVVYGVAWATGLVGVAAPSPAVWVVAGIVMFALNAVLVTGEEIGWRGYMLGRLIAARVPQPLAASGLIWGSWHLPLVLWAGYADGPSPVLSSALMLVMATGFGYLLARFRLATGSIWPVIALHAAWNTAIQAGFDPATTGAGKALWVGESGLLTALVLVIVAVVAARRHRSARGASGTLGDQADAPHPEHLRPVPSAQ